MPATPPNLSLLTAFQQWAVKEPNGMYSPWLSAVNQVAKTLQETGLLNVPVRWSCQKTRHPMGVQFTLSNTPAPHWPTVTLRWGVLDVEIGIMSNNGSYKPRCLFDCHVAYDGTTQVFDTLDPNDPVEMSGMTSVVVSAFNKASMAQGWP